jgi:hypothetical protein
MVSKPKMHFMFGPTVVSVGPNSPMIICPQNWEGEKTLIFSQDIVEQNALLLIQYGFT